TDHPCHPWRTIKTRPLRKEQDDVAVIRHQQYQDALKDDCRFLKKFMMIPFEMKNRKGKTIAKVEGADEGVFPTNAEGLAKLRPVMPDGTVTFGTQTFPADGSTSMVVCDEETAAKLSGGSAIKVRILAFGQARVERGFMPTATVPAARQAMERAGIKIEDIKVIKTHNPFALNDVYFSREMGVKVENMNNYGSPLIWGHPQGPTGVRVILEVIEELAEKGGGLGLFTGCAAGDSSMATVVRVDT
ncbi:thiolase family protein, partial [Acidobacteriota bacterium]